MNCCCRSRHSLVIKDTLIISAVVYAHECLLFRWRDSRRNSVQRLRLKRDACLIIAEQNEHTTLWNSLVTVLMVDRPFASFHKPSLWAPDAVGHMHGSANWADAYFSSSLVWFLHCMEEKRIAICIEHMNPMFIDRAIKNRLIVIKHSIHHIYQRLLKQLFDEGS